MEHKDKVKAILFIRPDADFILSGEDLQWLDNAQVEPTDAEIAAGLVAYQAAQKTETKAQATAKSALLDKLGITAEEAVLLLS
jgi:hypothetical protein